MLVLRSLVCFMSLLLFVDGGRVHASEKNAEERYRNGLQFMEAGNFLEAADEFWAAYQLERAKPLLWNAARAYHKGKNLRRARELYQRFLEIEKQSEPRWKTALELSQAITRELESRSSQESLAKKEGERQRLKSEIQDNVTRELLSKMQGQTPSSNSVETAQTTIQPTDWTLPCLLYTSPSPRDKRQSRMPSSA